MPKRDRQFPAVSVRGRVVVALAERRCRAVYVLALLVTRLSLLFTAMAAALLMAGVLPPAAAGAARAGVPRVLSAWMVLVGFVAVLGGAAWFIGRAVSNELDDLRGSLAEGIDRVRDWLVEGPVPLMATVNAAVVHLSRRGAEPTPGAGEAR